MILVQNLRLLLNGNNLIIKILTSLILIFNLSYSSAQYVEVLKKENGICNQKATIMEQKNYILVSSKSISTEAVITMTFTTTTTTPLG